MLHPNLNTLYKKGIHFISAQRIICKLYPLRGGPKKLLPINPCTRRPYMYMHVMYKRYIVLSTRDNNNAVVDDEGIRNKIIYITHTHTHMCVCVYVRIKSKKLYPRLTLYSTKINPATPWHVIKTRARDYRCRDWGTWDSDTGGQGF